MSVAMHLNLFYTRRVQNEGPLYPNSVGSDSAYGKVPLVAAISQADDPAAHELDSLPLALDNA
jgi:hypothetical protein